MIQTLDSLDRRAPLWRYIRFTSFLKLLHGQCFIPTIASLRKTDASENRIPFYDGFHLQFKITKVLEQNEFLLDRANPALKKQIEHNGAMPDLWQRLLMSVWLDYLDHSRCVWCWHASSPESIALWNIYSHQGVAIRTSIDEIENAVRGEGPREALAAKVDYIQRGLGNNQAEYTRPTHLYRPFLFKLASYAHEKEVRVIFAKDPEHETTGFYLHVDPSVLIKEVRLSPFMIPPEADQAIEFLRETFQFLHKIPFSQSTEILEDPFERNSDFLHAILEPIGLDFTPIPGTTPAIFCKL